MFMREKAKPKDGQTNPMPPQLFSDDEYLGVGFQKLVWKADLFNRLQNVTLTCYWIISMFYREFLNLVLRFIYSSRNRRSFLFQFHISNWADDLSSYLKPSWGFMNLITTPTSDHFSLILTLEIQHRMGEVEIWVSSCDKSLLMNWVGLLMTGMTFSALTQSWYVAITSLMKLVIISMPIQTVSV